MAGETEDTGKAGRRLSLVIAGTGVLWVLANLIGSEYGWSNRVRALFDLLALAGFGGALWIAIGLWRARKD
ncbi:hypothetical protein E4Z66_05395 [Aliishimia ponticola]|uniref:DUF5337 domain-containing protein n=1 Tax=Aliishimia ponticola TaxID=2499833 RepID=A0A4S4NH43_9RHOB|nr:DUF5337 domain-containing protein [Aliishimia ponticola]THH38994.1 hypothetical protein E4Z66_05395 [Aliishimia ponticola]